MSERYTPRYFSQQGASSTGNDFLENRPSNAEYGVAFDPGFGDAELIDEQDTWSNNNTILPTLDELTYGYSQTQYGLPSGGSQSRSGLESSIQWNGILPNAGPPITSHAEGFETWQAPESSYGNAAPSIPYHGIPQQHGTYQDWFPYDNGQLNDGSYIPAAFSTHVSETQREPYVNLQHTVSQQYSPYQAGFSHNDGMFQNGFITPAPPFPAYMGMGQGPTSNHTGTSQYDVSKQNGPHQTGLPYHKATQYKGLGPSVSSTPPLVDIQNGSVSNTFHNGSTYSRQRKFREVTHDTEHAIPSQAGGPAAFSSSGNTDATTSPESKNSDEKDLTPQSTTPVFENNESADVVEEDEEDDNEEEIVPEGQHSVTQEEEDRDGTLVVVSSMGGRGWGKIGKKNGVEVYFNPTTSKWQEYLTHDSMRTALIDKAQAEYPGEEYRHPDPHSGGGTSYGVTSFFKPHQNWGSEKNRADLPDCVFKWPSDKETARDSSSDGPDDDAEDEARRCRQDYPGPMKWGDKILLDHRNQPVADHDIPATLSGSTPGYKLQAMRLLNPNITQYDLLARMPRQIQREKKGVVSVKYLGTKNTHVNMPMQRFRDTAGCIAGARREGSRVIIEGLLKLFGHHGFDPAKSGSTRGFPRNLKPWEKMEVKLGNAGSYSNRAGTRALNGQKRKATHEKMLKAIDNGKKRDAAKGGKPASNTEIDAVKASRQSSPEQAGDISEALQQPPASIGTLDHQASTVETESGAGQVSEDDAPSKRRRKNATPAAKSRQPSLRKNGRAPQTQRYGAEGAPVPFPPPEAFDFSANNTFLPNTGDISTHLSQRLQPRFEGYKTQQVLGKHGRGQPMDQWNEDTHVPQQYSSEQNTQDTYSPQPKRRRMPKTGGYYAPLLQVPEMQLVKKARGVERDAHLGAPQLNIDDTVPEVYGTPQLEEQHLTPSPLSISGSIVNPDEDARAEEALLVNSQTSPVANEEGPEPLLGPVPGQFEQDLDEAPGAEEALLVNNQAPQAAKEQGSQPPLAPVPGHAGQELPIDIRDVPPADGWQSQSLHNALAYTRDSYREWTGEEAPVTNLEDCYNVQYREIEIAFQLWWISEKNPQFWDPLPELFQVKAWSGTVWDWEAPESMEYLQEPRRRGRQAARNEDGSLQQPEFHWNLEDHSWYDANAEEEL